MELLNLGECYGLKVRENYIKSKYDEWFIQEQDGYFKLYHKNKKNDKDKYHLQTTHKFMSHEEVFKKIKCHDEHVYKSHYNRNPTRIEMLFKQIACTI